MRKNTKTTPHHKIIVRFALQPRRSGSKKRPFLPAILNHTPFITRATSQKKEGNGANPFLSSPKHQIFSHLLTVSPFFVFVFHSNLRPPFFCFSAELNSLPFFFTIICHYQNLIVTFPFSRGERKNKAKKKERKGNEKKKASLSQNEKKKRNRDGCPKRSQGD